MGHCWLNLGIQNKMVGHILLFYFTCSPKPNNTLQIYLTSIELVLSKTFSLFEKNILKLQVTFNLCCSIYLATQQQCEKRALLSPALTNELLYSTVSGVH